MDNRDSAPGRTVDDGTILHTDVDKQIRARPKRSRSSPEGVRGRCRAPVDDQPPSERRQSQRDQPDKPIRTIKSCWISR